MSNAQNIKPGTRIEVSHPDGGIVNEGVVTEVDGEWVIYLSDVDPGVSERQAHLSLVRVSAN